MDDAPALHDRDKVLADVSEYRDVDARVGIENEKVRRRSFGHDSDLPGTPKQLGGGHGRLADGIDGWLHLSEQAELFALMPLHTSEQVGAIDQLDARLVGASNRL